MTSTHRFSSRLMLFLASFIVGAAILVPAAARAALPDESKQQMDKRMAWWRDGKFGMFIHGGLYAIPAGEWNGTKVGGLGEWIMHNGKIPQEEYSKLQQQFNPVKFNKYAQHMRGQLKELLAAAPDPIDTVIVLAVAGDEPAAASAAPAAKKDPYAWRELFDGKTLLGWKSPKFGGEGKVEVKDGAIVMNRGDSMTGVTWTGKPPKTNYEISLEGMRLDGIDFFCTTTFPVGDEFCTFVTGGWGGTVVGLSNVDFYDASDNATSSFFEFKDNKWYKFRIRVTDARIETWIDDKQVVNQERKDHKFGIRMEVDLSRPLGISTWCTKGQVRNIKLRELKPEEVKAAEKKAE